MKARNNRTGEIRDARDGDIFEYEDGPAEWAFYNRTGEIHDAQDQYVPILDEAKRVVYGPREEHYDHPRADFARTVGMINALFARKLKEPLTPAEFGLIMICCKLSREIHKHKRDNLVDIAGYAETIGRVLDEPA